MNKARRSLLLGLTGAGSAVLCGSKWTQARAADPTQLSTLSAYMNAVQFVVGFTQTGAASPLNLLLQHGALLKEMLKQIQTVNSAIATIADDIAAVHQLLRTTPSRVELHSLRTSAKASFSRYAEILDAHVRNGSFDAVLTSALASQAEGEVLTDLRRVRASLFVEGSFVDAPVIALCAKIETHLMALLGYDTAIALAAIDKYLEWTRASLNGPTAALQSLSHIRSERAATLGQDRGGRAQCFVRQQSERSNRGKCKGDTWTRIEIDRASYSVTPEKSVPNELESGVRYLLESGHVFEGDLPTALRLKWEPLEHWVFDGCLAKLVATTKREDLEEIDLLARNGILGGERCPAPLDKQTTTVEERTRRGNDMLISTGLDALLIGSAVGCLQTLLWFLTSHRASVETAGL